MRAAGRQRAGAILLAVPAFALPASAQAGFGSAAHGSRIRFCFVGNAMTAKPEDVKFITDHMKIFENVAHIKYEMMGNGVCPPPTRTPDGKFDVHAGDLRIGVPGTLDHDGKTPITGLALGKGCGDPGTTGWWGNFPVNLNVPRFRACRLNSFVRKGMALNKILHEIGHTLGLIHEHERGDIAQVNDPMVQICHKDVPYYGKGGPSSDASTLITPYDRDSVMHYEINTRIDPKNVPAGSRCNIGNDNGSTGLSTYDRLTLRILYPHRKKVAEYVGTTVIAAGERLRLRNEWGTLGALTANVIRSPQWILKRGSATVTAQSGVDFDFAIQAAGEYSLSYAFKDMRGHSYANTIAVKVMAPAAIKTLPGVIAAQAPLF
jgi:hypothetical protein